MGDDIILKRDCEAVLIPAGTKVTLQAGEPVTITQALGGSYTVIIHGNMARIAAGDADALGKETLPPAASGTLGASSGAPETDAKAAPPEKLTEEEILNTLRTCY